MNWPSAMRIGLWNLTAAAVLNISGCAGVPVDKTLQAEELLGTAGFQLKMADTPETLEEKVE